MAVASVFRNLRPVAILHVWIHRASYPQYREASLLEMDPRCLFDSRWRMIPYLVLDLSSQTAKGVKATEIQQHDYDRRRVLPNEILDEEMSVIVQMA